MSGSTSTYWPAQVQQLRLGDVVLDLRYRRVQRPDGQVELPQRMFDLLLLFAAEPGVLHSRNDLFERVWCGVVVEDSNLSQSVWMLRRALGEQRRHWIRTVAKSGYVFDPPSTVEVLSSEPAGDPSTPVRTTTEHTPLAAMALWKQLASIIPSSIARPFAALGALVAIIATANVVNSRNRLIESPPTVALVAVHDQGGSDPATTSLLYGWLEWKLSMRPEVLLLSQEHLAADETDHSEARVILLSSGRVADVPDRVYVQTRIEDGMKPRRIRVEGPPDQFAELVDQVSAKTLERLFPGQPRHPRPALRLDAHGIELHHRMREARQRREWVRAAEIGQELSQHAPSFGLVHWHLARINAALNRIHPAREHQLAAQRLLAPLPPVALDLLQAQRLILDGEHEAAIHAHRDLLDRYPHQKRLLLDLATALNRAGHPSQARDVLAAANWPGQPVGMRLGKHLLSAQIELALGNPGPARTHARQAERLAAEAGWHYERGFAALALADADVVEHRGVFEPHLFDQAAEHFEAAGDSMHALRARLMGEIPRVQANASDTLDALHAVAYRHYRAGEIDAYRTRLGQAITLAQVLDDHWANKRLGMDRVNEAFLTGDFGRARQELTAIEHAGLQGEAVYWIDQFNALLAYRLGELGRARTLLETAIARADGELGESPGDSAVRVIHRCLLGDVLLTEGEPSRARGEYGACGDTRAPVYQLMSETGLAAVDLYSGDVQAASARLTATLDRLDEIPSRPDQWLLKLSIAELLIRTHRADQAWPIYQELLPEIDASGYRPLAASVRIGLAEIAAAQGDWAGSAEYAEIARNVLTSGDWRLESRLTLLDAAISHAQGQFEYSRRLLTELEEQALAYGDTLTRVLTLSLRESLVMPIRDTIPAEPLRHSVAVTGLRGAHHEWLLGTQVRTHQLITIAMDGLRCPAQTQAEGEL